MRRTAQSAIVSVIGVIAAVAAMNGLFLNFVKPSMKWLILVASVVLVLIGFYGVLRDEPAHGPEHDHADHGAATDSTDQGSPRDAATQSGKPHDHGRGPRIGWLLLVPFLLLGVVVPPPLGSFSAQQDSGLPRVESADGLPALQRGSAPLELSLGEYSARALYDETHSLQGRTVRLTGFVSSEKGGDGWTLARLALSCCAADSYAVKVKTVGGQRFPDNTWLDVVGTWQPSPVPKDPRNASLPIIKITSMTRVAPPENPYEY